MTTEKLEQLEKLIQGSDYWIFNCSKKSCHYGAAFFKSEKVAAIEAAKADGWTFLDEKSVCPLCNKKADRLTPVG